MERRAGGSPLRLLVTWRSSETVKEEDLQLGKLCLPPPRGTEGVGSGGRKVREEGEGDEGDFQRQTDVFSASSERAEPYGDKKIKIQTPVGFEAKHSPAGCREAVGSGPWAGCLPGQDRPPHPCRTNECWLAVNFLSSMSALFF